MPRMGFFEKKRIYLDYASATPPSTTSLEVMRKAEGLVGNPGALHREGVEAKNALEDARALVARELSAKPREIVFTSGLTESINLALLGLARQISRSHLGHSGLGDALANTHWVVSAIEHVAVLEAFSEIERQGGIVTYLSPDSRGIFSPEKVVKALRPETVLISIGWTNNEIGVVQPLRNISRAIKELYPKILFHSDAGQAPLYLSPQVHTLGIDLLSLGSNKLYGPHGSGALYVSSAALLAPITLGGSQERNLRAGTENVALAAGFASAFQESASVRESEARRLKVLRDDFARELLEALPDAAINGALEQALPHILNVSIPGIQSEYVTLSLDSKGIAISTKSACKEGEERRSHVIDALYSGESSDAWRAAHTLRFSLGRDSSAEDLSLVVRTLVEIVQRTRKAIPIA